MRRQQKHSHAVTNPTRSTYTSQWRHNDHDSVSTHQPHDCLLNRLFRHRSKKTSKLRVTGLCEGNPPGTGEFPAQMASYAENFSIWWRHHECCQRHAAASHQLISLKDKNLVTRWLTHDACHNAKGCHDSRRKSLKVTKLHFFQWKSAFVMTYDWIQTGDWKLLPQYL